MYIYGGRTGLDCGDVTLSDLWCFDSETGLWTEVVTTGSKPPALSYHVLATSGSPNDERIYLFGGCTIDPPHGRTNGLWQLDTNTNEWFELSKPIYEGPSKGPCGRGGPGLAAFENTIFVAFGYNGKEEQRDLWRFDLNTKSWTKVTPSGDVTPTPRSVTDLVALPSFATSRGDQLFVFGGEFTPSAQGHDGAGEYHSDAYVYDLTSNTWSQSQPAADSNVPVARGWFNSLRYGASVIVFGGFDGVERRNDVYRWEQQ